MEPLRTTYETATAHRRWQDAYRTDPRILAFDERIYGWIFERLQPRGSWLDAGCGSGERSVLLAKHANKVLSVDISPLIIEEARARANRLGMGDRISFQCSALEELASGSCDNAHSRGVLMHIPDWRSALSNICRNVRPGGFVVLFEQDARSIETGIVRLVRLVSKRKSEIRRSADGWEFWSEVDGKPFLVRMSNPDAIEDEMRKNGIEPVFRRPLFLFDSLRFPKSFLPVVTFVNRLWFEWNLPLGSGVLIVGRKRD